MKTLKKLYRRYISKRYDLDAYTMELIKKNDLLMSKK